MPHDIQFSEFAARVIDKLDHIEHDVTECIVSQRDYVRRLEKLENEIEARVRVLEQWRFYVVGFVAAVGAALAFVVKS